MALTEATLEPLPQPVSLSLPGKGQLWTGRVLAIVAVGFLLFDAYGKIALSPYVVQASTHIGFKVGAIRPIGITLLLCTALYVLPRTSVLGSIFLSAYLGGAVATMVLAGAPGAEMLFPILFAVVLWISLWLRLPQLRPLFPLVRI